LDRGGYRRNARFGGQAPPAGRPSAADRRIALEARDSPRGDNRSSARIRGNGQRRRHRAATQGTVLREREVLDALLGYPTN